MQKSKNSKKILSYFSRKYCKELAPIGLIKACSVVSSVFKESPRLHVCMVAPTRQFKSRTSIEMQTIFSPKWYNDLGSDFTIHGLYQKCKKDKTFGVKKCWNINDGTLLLSSKGKRTKDRLINGFAEILSEGVYKYSDNLISWNLCADISLIMNLTLESYQQNKKMLTENTFLERFITIFFEIPDEKIDDLLINKRTRVGLKFDDKKLSKLKDFELNEDLTNHAKKITQYSKRFSFLNFKSRQGMHDIVETLLKAHACLNERKKIINEDFEFLELLEPYLQNPLAPNEHKILMLRSQGKSHKDICEILGQNPDTYRPYVSRILKQARMRGIYKDKKEQPNE